MRILVLVLLLTACSNPAEDAERRYALVAHEGTADEKCQAARSVESEYLKALDREKYRGWHVRALLDCNRAALDRL
jgi:hypothetical protein